MYLVLQAGPSSCWGGGIWNAGSQFVVALSYLTICQFPPCRGQRCSSLSEVAQFEKLFPDSFPFRALYNGIAVTKSRYPRENLNVAALGRLQEKRFGWPVSCTCALPRLSPEHLQRFVFQNSVFKTH